MTGVVEAPNGAHFTSCAPDYDRDEDFQREYAASAASPDAWQAFRDRYLAGSESDYQAAVAARRGGVGMTNATDPQVPATDATVTRAEVCVVACADVFRDNGEVLASAFGTIPASGYGWPGRPSPPTC